MPADLLDLSGKVALITGGSGGVEIVQRPTVVAMY
jgi:hypothetical protein